MFGWLKKATPVRLEPEASWTVIVQDGAFKVTDHKGTMSVLPTDDLSGVAIETNDTGPWGTDVWWLLFGDRDQLACGFPQGATGEQEVIDYLMKLTGFDHSEMISAMTSTNNAVFRVWRR